MGRMLLSFILLTVLLLSGCGREELAERPAPLPVPAEKSEAGPEDAVIVPASPQGTISVENEVSPAPALEERLAEMSLEGKISQLLLASCHESGSAERAAVFGVSGLCLYADAFQGKTKAQVQEMTAALQAVSPFPLLIAVDEEGGSVCRVSTNTALRAIPFWAPRDLYACGGWELIRSDTEEKADLLLSLGVNVNLAPVCDVPLGEGDYIYPRCFSLDASLTAQYASTVVSVMQEKKIGCTLKHFPGYGGSGDTHKGLAFDSRPLEAFQTSDFLPFSAGIEAGADSILVSHNIVQCMDGEWPASLSPEVHRLLREDFGYDGVILSDDLYMDAITQFTGGQNAAVQALLAGNDLICCADFEASYAAILDAVNNGTVSVSRIDESVLRVLQWKDRLGLLG